jgi:hypothetical protein
MPALLMRNLRLAAGLCNGVRMIVRQVGTRVATCEIAVGDHARSAALFPRVIARPSDDKLPLSLSSGYSSLYNRDAVYFTACHMDTCPVSPHPVSGSPISFSAHLVEL